MREGKPAYEMKLKRNEKLQNVVDGQYFRKNEIIEKDINMYYDFNTMIKEYIVANSEKHVTCGQILSKGRSNL